MAISGRLAPIAAMALFCAAFAYAEHTSASFENEKEFLAEMHQAMLRMDQGMSAVPSGSIDADFVAMMVPHHQAAIDTAQLQLRYGQNKQLARIAQEIIVEQQQEIAAMRRALRDSP